MGFYFDTRQAFDFDNRKRHGIVCFLILTVAGLPKTACHLSTRHGLTLLGIARKHLPKVVIAGRGNEADWKDDYGGKFHAIDAWGVNLPCVVGVHLPFDTMGILSYAAVFAYRAPN